MAIKLASTTTANQLLKIVSVLDDAIDWDATYPDSGLEEVRKHSKYTKDNKAGDLVFKDGCLPTVFVFKHPKRVDVARQIRGLYSKQITASGRSDLMTDVFDHAFIGTQEGFEGAMEKAPRVDDKVEDTFYQKMEDAGVLEEIASAFIRVAHANPAAEAIRKK